MQHSRSTTLGETHDVDHPHRGRLNRFDGVVLVRFGRGRTRQIEDPIGFDIQRMYEIVANQLKARMPDQMPDVLFGARKEVVDADHIIATFNQSIAEMTSQKPSATSNKDS